MTILSDFEMRIGDAEPSDTLPHKLFAGSITPSGVSVWVPQVLCDLFMDGVTLQLDHSSIDEPTIEVIANANSRHHPHEIADDKYLFLPVRRMFNSWSAVQYGSKGEDVAHFNKKTPIRILMRRDYGLLLTFPKED